MTFNNVNIRMIEMPSAEEISPLHFDLTSGKFLGQG